MRKYIDSELKKLKSLLSDDHVFYIPKYQREYSWNADHVGEFWQDLINHKSEGENIEYYFGTLILVDKDGSGETFSVVDGQQRLTTSMVFLSVIRDLLLDLDEESEANTLNDFIFIDDKVQVLNLSKNNSDFFNKVILPQKMYTEKAHQLDPKIVDVRNKLLAGSYTALHVKIEEYLKKYPSSEEKTKFLIQIYQHFLKYFTVVRTVIDSPDRAYRIFETINNRGAGLAESDLVKNYLLQLVDHDNLDVDLQHDKWMELLSILDQSKTKESYFLWNYLMAYYGPTTPDEVYSKIQSKIKNGSDATIFIEKLITGAEIFLKLKKPQLNDWFQDQTIVDDLKIFDDLTAKAVYPVLVKGCDVFGNDKKLFSKFIKIIQIYYFRTRTICNTGAPEIRKVMDSLCKKLCDDKIIPSILSLREFLKDHSTYPVDAVFENDFTYFSAVQKNALYIIIKLNQGMTKSQSMSLTAVKGHVQLEHIMPKTIKQSPWEHYLKKIKNLKDDTMRENYHKKCLWRLGNLTILNSISNPMASNDAYEKKLEIYKSDNSQITNTIDNAEWNEDSILSRQVKLAQHAKNIWTLNVNI